jgi:hypothetical protein
MGGSVSASDRAIVAGLGRVAGRLERFDVTAPVIFAAAGLVLMHGPLGVPGVAPVKG